MPHPMTKAKEGSQYPQRDSWCKDVGEFNGLGKEKHEPTEVTEWLFMVIFLWFN